MTGNGVLVEGGKAINKDAKTEAIFDDMSTIEFMPT